MKLSFLMAFLSFVLAGNAQKIPTPKDSTLVDSVFAEKELEEIIIRSTRTSRTIRNTPTRIETIELEEIDEKNNMRPSNVAMLLHESTGLQVQQTSATSANASLRIQGLDGRYTQILKDGFPNFGNFASGLSVLEIPPLDLAQVEIIKGPASPLFGGGAIAGVINFISKVPQLKPERNFIVNYSNVGQLNLGSYTSARNDRIGFSLLALYNHQKTYDVDDDDFTEIPKSNEFTINPRLFLYPNRWTTIQIGNSFTKTSRSGGDIYVVNGKMDSAHQYFEKNKTTRNNSVIELERTMGEKKKLIARQSFSIFDRSIEIPSYRFAGISYQTYSDLSFITTTGDHSFVSGVNFIYDRFREKTDSTYARDNRSQTGGVYVQHTLDVSEKIKLETGLRAELIHYSNPVYKKTEFFLLPRISLLIRYNNDWSSRIGAGMGYKQPSLFTEATETIQYRNLLQLDNVRSEKSYGATADINYRAMVFPEFSFSINHLWFYTMIKRPLILLNDAGGNYHFENSGSTVQTGGFESNLKLIYKENLKLFLGYTITLTKAGYLPLEKTLPLVPTGKLNIALIYEKENNIKIGLEGYFTGRQYLSDGTRTPAFHEFGLMVEKIFRNISFYINFENFTDTRQSRYKGVVSGSHLDPQFDEIWTHTEGFVFNGGMKIKF